MVTAPPARLTVPKVRPVAKPKNLHARLAGLNSLKRNIQAYINSNDPRMVGIRDFVVASANWEIALEALDAAQSTLDGLLTQQTQLTNQLTTLTGQIDAMEAAPDFDPADLTYIGLQDQVMDLNTQLSTLAASITTATNAVTQADLAATAASVGTDDGSLGAALEAAANPNREVDDEIMEWARNVLGVGDAIGKIDDYRSLTEAAPEEEVIPVANNG